MAGALRGHAEPELASRDNGRHDVGHTGRLDDRDRPLVDAELPGGSRLVPAGIGREAEGAIESLGQRAQGGRDGDGGSSFMVVRAYSQGKNQDWATLLT